MSGIDFCRRALTWFEAADDRCGQAATWDSLGYIHHQLGDHRMAAFGYGRALDIDSLLGDRFGE